MKVSLVFKSTGTAGAWKVLRSIAEIGIVVYDSGINLWLFRHYMIDDLIFVGETREDAVSKYYNYFGGTVTDV